MVFFIIFVLCSVICWGSVCVILWKKPVRSYKGRMKIILFLGCVMLLNVLAAAFCNVTEVLSKEMCVIVAIVSSLPAMFGILMLKRYFVECMSSGFFPFKITRVIDGRVFGKLCVDDYHLVVDAELVDLAKEQPAELEGEVIGRAVCAYSVGERLWVDVKSDNVDLPFVTVTVH